MKYALFGDIHGTELKDLEKALAYEKPDVLICTGDFDQMRSIHQFIDLENKYKKQGKIVVKVPGNHDHAILTGLYITSGTLMRQGKDCFGLHKELKNDSVAHNYIDDLVNSKELGKTNKRVGLFLDEYRFGKDFKTIVIHGAYGGDLSSFPRCSKDIRDLWYRLNTKWDHAENFEVMGKKGYKVMIRGHDHNPVYTYNDLEKGIVSYYPKTKGKSFRLLKERQHTINPGALFDGDFAIIDTDVNGEFVPILTYHIL